MSNKPHRPTASQVRKPGESSASQRAHARQPATKKGMSPQRLMTIIGLMAAAFFLAYSFASAKNQTSQAQYASAATGGYAAQQPGAAATGGGTGGGGGGCCGGGGPAVEGRATLQGSVQTINVDTSSGSFNPNVIRVKAGVATEINFSQSGGGCLSGVYFPDFNINEDLTAGGKTIKLPPLSAGTYQFYCQMQMVSAQIVAE